MKIKSVNLRKRKVKLSQEIAKLGEELKKVGQELQDRGYKSFMESGEAEMPSQEQLEKLQQKLRYFQEMDLSIDKEISKALRHERLLAINRKKRELRNLDKDRQVDNDRIRALLRKVEEIRKECKVRNEERLRVQLEIKSFQRTKKQASLRLYQMEKFLEDNFLTDGGELRAKVLAARKANRELLRVPGGQGRITQNFVLEFDRDTGKLLKKLDFITFNYQTPREVENPIARKRLKQQREKMIREVT